MAVATFNGLRVLALESRHAKEIAKLIASYGGLATVAPAVREVSLDSHQPLDFAKNLLAGKFDLVIFLTGAGARALFTAVGGSFSRQELAAALERTVVVARGVAVGHFARRTLPSIGLWLNPRAA